MNKFCLLFVLFFATSYAMAVNDQVPIDREITLIRTYPSFAVIGFTPGFANTQNCGTTVQTRVILNFTESTPSKEMYSAALTAATAKKKIGFGLSGCATGTLKYPLVYRIDVEF